MKQTNDRAVLQLLHAPTGTYTDWKIAQHAVPSVHYINNRVEELRNELQKLYDIHDIDPKKEGWTDGIEEPLLEQISEKITKISRLKMDGLSSILTPVEGVPEVYESKREYLEQCISDISVVQTVMDFFSEHSNNSIASPEDCPTPILFKTEAGEPWESKSTNG